MGIIKLLREGSWWVTSQSDPRWNTNGRALVGMFGKPEGVDAHIEKMTPILGEPPEDLEWGYMKD